LKKGKISRVQGEVKVSRKRWENGEEEMFSERWMGRKG
jgi:hypothetical protein